MKRTLTAAHKRCLREIRDAGSCVLVSHGRVLAAGEFMKFMPETFLRLVGDGLIQFSEPYRMCLTAAGEKALEEDE